MDQEAEAMKTKKMLWPWAERQVKGEKRASRQPVSGSDNMEQANTENEVFDDTDVPYDSSPIEISEWFHTFMCMNIPIFGWFYLKKLARQSEHNKMQDFARAYLYYKMVFLAVSLVIVILLLIVGILGINKLFAYMELL